MSDWLYYLFITTSQSCASRKHGVKVTFNDSTGFTTLLELDSRPQTAVVCCFGGNALVYGGLTRICSVLSAMFTVVYNRWIFRSTSHILKFFYRLVWIPDCFICFRCRGEHEKASGCFRLLLISYEGDQIISSNNALLLASLSWKVTGSSTSPQSTISPLTHLSIVIVPKIVSPPYWLSHKPCGPLSQWETLLP